jgi:hypothetical protein
MGQALPAKPNILIFSLTNSITISPAGLGIYPGSMIRGLSEGISLSDIKFKNEYKGQCVSQAVYDP